MPTCAIKPSLGASLVAWALAVQAQSPVAPNAVPQGAQVLSGQASIQSQPGSNVIQQTTNRAILQWDSFNIGKDASVKFEQPNASSVALNRVLSTDPSQILGRLQANGRIILSNPNGVLFGATSQVDVGGLIVTVLDIQDDDFLNDRYQFSGSGTGRIHNAGRLAVELGGYIALLGREVINEGIIFAQEGSVALASGSAISLTFGSDQLLSVVVDQPVVDALVANKHLVRAPGGRVILSAQSANAIFESVVQQAGQVEVPAVNQVNGRILIQGGDKGKVEVTGELNASALSPQATGQAGSIQVTGDRVSVEKDARLYAKGHTQGGEILVGGSWQGKDASVPQANDTRVAKGAVLDASGVDKGSGGTIVAWSNLQDGRTYAAGEFNARGGEQGGEGGRIETSGGYLNVQGVTGSAAAPKGEAGLWLFDPHDITIVSGAGSTVTASWDATTDDSQIDVSSITSLLDQGTAVEISTGSTTATGDDTGLITVNAAISSTNSLANLSLIAADDIILNQPITLRDGTLRLQAGGDSISQAVSADLDVYNLSINAPTAVVTLANTGNRVGALAANVGSLTLKTDEGIFDGSAFGSGLYVGQVGTLSGIAATGVVDLSSTENIFVIRSISTTNTSASALTIEAGRGQAAGAYNGLAQGDVIFSSGVTASVGSGGRAVYYSGSYDGGGAGLITLIGTGTSAFRYNSTTTSSGFDTVNAPLANSGNYAVFRQQPTLTLLVSDATQTYSLFPGDNLGITYSIDASDLLHGDLQANVIAGAVSYSAVAGGPGLSTSGRYKVGEHAIETSGLTDRYGYNLVQETGTLTVTPVSVTVSNGAAYNREYNATSTVSVSGDVVGGLSNDVLSLSSQGTVASANAGVAKQVTASLDGADASNYALTQPGLTVTVRPKELAVAGTTTANKVYDGTTTASVTVGTVSGFVGNERVTATASGAFNSKDVASATEVTASYTLADGTSGGLAANYNLDATTGISASITAKPLSVTDTVAANRSYDATTDVAITVGQLSGFVGTETVSVSGTPTALSSPNAGTYTTTASYTLANGANGGLATNYSLADTTDIGVVVSPKQLTISAPAIADKTYDASTSPGALTLGSLSGFIGNETVTATGLAANLVSANAGSYITTVSYTLADGTNGGLTGNYSIVDSTAVAAVIIPKVLTISAPSIASKGFDGTTAAGTLTTGTLSGLVGTQELGVTGSASALQSANVGSYTTTVQYGLVDGANGGLAANYSLADTTGVSASIARALLSISAPTIASKVYDGSAAPGALTVGSLSGLVSGQELVVTGAAGDLSSADAGSYTTTVSYSLFNGTGGLASNYQLADSTGIAAIIAPKLLTISGTTAAGRDYDGTTTATITAVSGNLAGQIASETALSVTAVGEFDSKDAGTRSATAIYTLVDGAAPGAGEILGKAANYALDSTNGHVAVISPKAITVSNSSIANKDYDGLVTPGAVTVGTPGGLIGSETLSLTGQADDLGFANAGAYSTTVRYTAANGENGGLASNYTVTPTAGVSATIDPKALSITSPTIADKTYDTNTTAGTLTVGQLSGLVGNETLGVSGAASALASPNAGSQTVNVIYTLTDGANGGLEANYTLADSTGVTALVLPKALTIGAPSIASRDYDGTATPGTLTVDSVSLAGFLGQQTVTVTGLAADLGSANADSYNTTVTYTLANGTNGGLAVNYSLLPSTNVSAVIDPVTLTIAAPTIEDKVYDSTTATGVVNIGLITAGLVGAEELGVTGWGVALASKDVGSYATAVSYTLTNGANGGLASNYRLLDDTGIAAEIIPKQLVIAGTSIANKTYDASATSGSLTVGDLAGFVGTETVTATGAAANLSSANAGTYTTDVSYTLASGANGGLATNYSLDDSTNVAAVIDPKQLTIAAPTIANKEYDGTTNAGSVTEGILTGLVGAETVIAAGSAANLAVANAGAYTTTVTYTLADGTNNGQAANYSLAASTGVGAVIDRKQLSISSPTIAAKIYNGDKNPGSVTTGNISGLVGSETVAVTGTASDLSGINVGNYQTTVAYTLTDGSNGGRAANYSSPSDSNQSAMITPRTLNPKGAQVIPKIYERGNDLALLNTEKLTLPGVIDADKPNVSVEVSGRYLQNSPGSKKNVEVNYQLSGDRASNYRVINPKIIQGEILPVIEPETLVQPALEPPGSLQQTQGVPLLVEGQPEIMNLPAGPMTSIPSSTLKAALTQWASWSSEEIREISTTQLRLVQPELLGLLSDEQIQAFSGNQIRALTPEQLLAVLPKFSRSQQNAVSDGQLAMLQQLLRF